MTDGKCSNCGGNPANFVAATSEAFKGMLGNGGNTKYPAIKLFSTLSFILSWVVAAIMFLAGLGGYSSFNNLAGFLAGFVAMLVIWIAGFFLWLFIRVVPEALTALVSIENNTRYK